MKNPLVVGYRGEIGSYILQGLIKFMPTATNILCFDQAESIFEKHDKIKKSDVIFLCVPIDETEKWLDTWQGFLFDKIIVEQTSLKSVFFGSKKIETIIKSHNLSVLSMHILFRPSSTPDHKDRNIALIGKQWADEKYCTISWFCSDFNGLFSQTCYFKSWQKHDEEMALQQAVVHRVILTLGEMIDKLPYTTYIGKQICSLKGRIQRGDYKLYKIIQENPYLAKRLKQFDIELKKFSVDKFMKKVGDK